MELIGRNEKKRTEQLMSTENILFGSPNNDYKLMCECKSCVHQFYSRYYLDAIQTKPHQHFPLISLIRNIRQILRQISPFIETKYSEARQLLKAA